MPASLYDRLITLPPPEPGVLAAPPAEIIAFNVHVRRKLHGWKQSTLASLAGVSLSTVERIERGEAVQPLLLEKVGAAFGYPVGYYTAPRAPLTQEQMAQEGHAGTVFVSVTAFVTQFQFRQMARCETLSFAPIGDLGLDHPGLSRMFELLSELAERMDLADHVPKSKRDGVRPAYRAIASQIAALRRQGIDVVGGVLHEPERSLDHYGVISAGHRRVDPGILKRRVIILDRRQITGAQDKEPAA